MHRQQQLSQAAQLGDSQLQAQEDFYLLDVIGGASVAALHPTRPLVAYSAGKKDFAPYSSKGCMVIVYDLLSDTKINLIQHQHEIQALTFSPPGAGNSNQAGEFLISLDFNSKFHDLFKSKKTKTISKLRVSLLSASGTGLKAFVCRNAKCLKVKVSSLLKSRWASLLSGEMYISKLFSIKQAVCST